MIITVSRDEYGKSLLCSVSDSGEGIPAEEFERIFEKFGQVETRKAGRTYSYRTGADDVQASCGGARRPYLG